jgi:L-alanine-DL-glutamate epimerase-like enolase superfamily enzyme
MMELLYAYQEWPYRETFRISRSSRANSSLFLAIVRDGDFIGRGECSYLEQYGHTREDVLAGLEAARDILSDNPSRQEIAKLIPNSSVRNAIDCAMWDLECRRSGQSVWDRSGIARQESIEVDLTISVNPIPKMCADARQAAELGYRILKLKADKDQVVERVSAIAAAVPGAKFVVDANEAWDLNSLERSADALHSLGVVLIEQPLHHQRDEALADYRGPIPVCADESCRGIADLDTLAERYQAINIKLDKAGGLTPGLELARAAKARGMGLMIGCSGPTSLGVAPAYVIATMADFVDLDGPALMIDDRAGSMRYAGGRLFCFGSDLWGG